MTGRVRVEEVLVFLGVRDPELLAHLRAEGLFEREELDPEEAEELRLAACWMRELGVNPAGVEVALRLRRRLLALEQRTGALLRTLLEESEREEPGGR